MKELDQVVEPVSNLGIYVSVPFCRAKCSFCNFSSGVGTAEALERYVGQLCNSITQGALSRPETAAQTEASVDTVYFGGGTPSLLEPAQLRRIFEVLRRRFKLLPDAEITMEAAPGQISDRVLETALALGVNRVSLGVQSFVDREAQAVGRSHTEQSCLEEFQRLQRAGVGNLGADLIAGLPYQTEASWARSLALATTCGLQHLSVYLLEIDEGSRLGLEVLNGGARLHAPSVASDALMASLYEQACETLPAAGYGQYEISNFAAGSFHSRHNLKYWMRAPYLGFGLDAHSMVRDEEGRATRWATAKTLTEYGHEGGHPQREPVSEREAFEEEVFLGLRLVAGLDRERLRPYPASWAAELDGHAAGLCREGLMGSDVMRLWLTAKGRLVSSEVFGELLAGVAA